MRAELVKRLLDLNREFYSHFALSFSETRLAGHLNLEPYRAYLADGTKLLDVGCGNGRLAERLDREGYRLDYVGLDSSRELIAVARSRLPTPKGVTAEFCLGDVARAGWAQSVVHSAPFDLALMLAVLHHLPGREMREQALIELATLLRRGAVLIMSNWQFQNSARLMRKVLPWPEEWGEEGTEPGDTLVDWKRGGQGIRYVHLMRQDEVELLARRTGYRVLDQFNANDDLDLFSVLQRGA